MAVLVSACGAVELEGEGSTVPTSSTGPPGSVLPAPETSPTVPPPSTEVTAPSTDAAPTLTGQPAELGTARLVAVGGSMGGVWMPIGWWDGESFGSIDSDLDMPKFAVDPVALASTWYRGPVEAIDGLERDDWFCQAATETGPSIPSFRLDDVKIEPDQFSSFVGHAVAITGPGEIEPRRVLWNEDIMTNRTLAREVVRAIESKFAGIDAIDYQAGIVAQIVIADLDGDSIEEAMYLFERVSSDSLGAVGDFSYLVALRQGNDGEITEQGIDEHVTVAGEPDEILLYRSRITGIADLNADGTMEVVVEHLTWNVQRYVTYEMIEGVLTEVMSATCVR